ncbi:MAG TPA: hypothetical protein ENK57_11965 [Polyangiaceae bacterium]|nr:hypothetical protein [Polyangiaceae bacterium]
MADGMGKSSEFRGTFVVAAVNSASGFLDRALAARTRGQAMQALEGAEQWIRRAREAVESGELPEGFGAPALRPAGPALPLEPLDDDGAGS